MLVEVLYKVNKKPLQDVNPTGALWLVLRPEVETFRMLGIDRLPEPANEWAEDFVVSFFVFMLHDDHLLSLLARLSNCGLVEMIITKLYAALLEQKCDL